MAFETVALAIILGVFAICGLLMLFIFLKLSHNILRIFTMMLTNSIVGLIAMGVLYLLGVKVPLTAPVIVSIVLFGLGGLGTLLILMFFGIQVG